MTGMAHFGRKTLMRKNYLAFPIILGLDFLAKTVTVSDINMEDMTYAVKQKCGVAFLEQMPSAQEWC